GLEPSGLSLKNYPILFHDTHGENVRLSPDKKRATRYESFCKGIAFSNRPIAVNERVYIKIAEVSANWSGVLRFGFTSNDPATINAATLPRYACPDLTNKPGYWAKALGERYAELIAVIYFYVTRSGDVMYGINGEEKGMFFNNVNVSNPLWALIDIYGNSMTIEFLDGDQLNNLAQNLPVANQPQNQVQNLPHNLGAMNIGGGQQPILPHRGLSRSHAVPSQPPLPTQRPGLLPPHVSQQHNSQATADFHSTGPQIKHHANVHFTPLQFHNMFGKNVRISPEKTQAARLPNEYSNGYVFLNRPIKCGEKVVIQLLALDRAYVGGMAFGLTACDPASLINVELPDDSDLLLDRPEYWVVNKDVCRAPEIGDELSFSMSNDGEIVYCKNGHKVATLMFVDKTLPLWMFFDIYGNTQKVRLLGLTGINSTAGALPQPQASPQGQPQAPPRRPASSPSLGGATSRIGGGLTVALPPRNDRPGTVSLPPPPQRPLPPIPPSRPLSMTSMPAHPPPPIPKAASNPYVPAAMVSSPAGRSTSPAVPQATTPDVANQNKENEESECTICWEQQVNTVLYTCGHMCMCYECAVALKESGDGLCPICRATIKDIIKAYRS
ncbi:unnamed protein product, partial [Owenia fusiformis]